MYSSYRCVFCRADTAIADGAEPACARCGSKPAAVTTARIIDCPTYYVEYRGWSQEVNTLMHELVSDHDEAKRFSATFRHTPLDAESDAVTVYGHSPSDVLNKVKQAIESAKWDVHYRGIMSRIDGMRKDIDRLSAVTEPQPPDVSPSAAPSPHAAAST